MSRLGVLGGGTAVLKTIVMDDNGNPVSTDALPTVYIYEPSIDDETIDAEIEAGVFTSAIANGTATLLGTGFYRFNYVVPSGAEEGTWRDVWIGEIDGAEVNTIQSFEVLAGGEITIQSLKTNEIVVVYLDKSIGNADETLTLGTNQTVSFTTQYNPFYADVLSVRMEGGPLINWMPDDVLALMIFWSSVEADRMTPRHICDAAMLCFAKGRFAILDVALKALMSPGGSFVNGFNSSGNGSKTLGELSIKKGTGGNSGSMSGGLDTDTFKALKKDRDEWWRVINAGACIVPGQGLAPLGAIRGLYDPARRPPGRLWEDPSVYYYDQPTVNMRSYRTGERLKRHGFDNLRYAGGSDAIS